jgi:hypothetical protein
MTKTDKPADSAEKLAGEELAGKPSLEEAIEWGKCEAENWEDMAGDYTLMNRYVSPDFQHLRRLVEAAENWQEFTKPHPLTMTELELERLSEERAEYVEKLHRSWEERGEQLGEKDRQIQTLRAQLDGLGKENAEKERRIEGLEYERDNWRDNDNRHVKQNIGLREQLAEKEREVERLREKMRWTERQEGASSFVEIPWGRYEEFLKWEQGRKVDPPPTEAEVEKVKQALRAVDKGDFKSFDTMDDLIAHLEKINKVLRSEPEVEKVASRFHDIYQQEAKRQGDVRHKDRYEDLSENIKEFDRVLARHAIAHGYRAEE